MLSSIPKHDRIPFGNQTHNMLHTLLYFLALLSLSTSANLAKLNHMPSQVLGFWRLGIAALLLAIWVFAIKRTPLPRITKDFRWVLLSGFFFFLHLWTFKYAAKNTSISHTMIIFSSNPVWASLGAVAFFNERLSIRLVLSYVLALLGVFILVSKDLGYQSWLTERYGCGIGIFWKDLQSLHQVLRKTDYPALKQAVLITRSNKLSLKANTLYNHNLRIWTDVL